MTEILIAGTDVINWRKFSIAVRNSSFCEACNSKFLPVVTERSWRILFQFELVDKALKPSSNIIVKIQ